MQKTLKIVMMTLLWVFVVAFVVFFHGRARHHRANTTVHSLRVTITDSLRDEMLVTSKAVEQWIERSKIPTIGVPVGDIDLAGIEQSIRGNGFIDRASAYVTYGGELRVEVSQRRPLLRLMVDGTTATSPRMVTSSLHRVWPRSMCLSLRVVTRLLSRRDMWVVSANISPSR